MNDGETDSLLLDLVNSRIMWPDGIRDEIGDDADARVWLRARGGSGSSDEIAGAREARTDLVEFLRGARSADVLRPWIAAMRKKAVIEGGAITWVLDVPDRHVVGAKAVEEWASLQAPTGSRIRECADPECQHFLIDRSASNRRKWHSMEQCGNRTKARRHYARSKQAAGE